MTFIKSFGSGRGLACFLTILACHVSVLGTAHADFLGPDYVTITMSDGNGHSASKGIANPFDNLPPQAQVPERVRKMIQERFELKDGNTVLGWVDMLGAELDGDPMAGINFSITAGGSDVTVTVSSATTSFPALMNPDAYAEAEVTLVDNDGDGVMISAVDGNNGLFKAIYNGSQEYASLLSTSSVKGGGVTFSEDTSGPIAGSVTSIQAQFSFQLSGGDSASGTGTFVVVPEPSTVALLICGLAALFAARRRS